MAPYGMPMAALFCTNRSFKHKVKMMVLRILIFAHFCILKFNMLLISLGMKPSVLKTSLYETQFQT
jgi:hypothetical protein